MKFKEIVDILNHLGMIHDIASVIAGPDSIIDFLNGDWTLEVESGFLVGNNGGEGEVLYPILNDALLSIRKRLLTLRN